MTLASIVFSSQVYTRMLASDVSTRRSGFPVRLNVFDHSSARARSPVAKHRTRITNPMRFIETLPPGKHTSTQPLRRGYARFVRLVPWKFGRLPSEVWPCVGQTNQSSFRKWHIQQPRARREGRSQPDLLHEQERCDGPQFVERQNEREHLPEFLAQPLVVKADSGHQIASQRDAHARRHHHRRYQRSRGPSRKKRIRNFRYRVQSKKRGDIKDQVHGLNQRKECPRQPTMRDGDFEFGM